MVSQRREHVAVWVTTLAKILADQQACHWAAWYGAHYVYPRNPPGIQLMHYQMKHARAVHERGQQLRERGLDVRVENQNRFSYTTLTRVPISGKPDIVAIDGASATIYDIKTGSPKSADSAQVMLYQLLLPYVMPWLEGKSVGGCVVYAGAEGDLRVEEIEIPADFSGRASRCVELIAGDTEPAPAPCEWACRYCDIPDSDCAARVGYLDENAIEPDDLPGEEID